MTMENQEKVPLTIDDLKANQEDEENKRKRKKRISEEYQKLLRYNMQRVKYVAPEDLKDEPKLKQDPAIYGGDPEETTAEVVSDDNNEVVAAEIVKEEEVQ